ncbi:UNVERIFIED_CONTAM: DUF2255 family protein [Microbacterium sp. SLM126]
MSPTWPAEQLRALDDAIEIEVSAPRRDGAAGPWVRIWVVVAGGEVFVRTWRRRATGWYGGAVRSGSARIRVAGAAIDVTVEVVGDENAVVVDSAYRAKYGDLAARSMVTTDAAASTLRLRPPGPTNGGATGA